jgi:hypothetical protein
MNNKILLTILLVVMVISLALISFYLYIRYTQYGTAQDNKTDVGQSALSPNTSSQNDAYLLNNNVPVIYNEELPSAKVGTVYKTTVEAGIYDLNVQLIGIVGSGLPAGLVMSPCLTEYNSPVIAKFATKNSYSLCSIEGTPQESGSFLVKVYFSVQGGEGKFFKALPLVVDP